MDKRIISTEGLRLVFDDALMDFAISDDTEYELAIRSQYAYSYRARIVTVAMLVTGEASGFTYGKVQVAADAAVQRLGREKYRKATKEDVERFLRQCAAIERS